MNRVGKFEKVSLGQFKTAMKNEFGSLLPNFGVETEQRLDEIWTEQKYPRRATKGSAGYDFFSPIGFRLAPGRSIKIPTAIRCRIDEGWWLGILPRSSIGFKYNVMLANTLGVIDSDYYNSDNEGHIMLKLTNLGAKELAVEQGMGIAQGIFLPYGITENDNATDVRNGGFGSTGN